MLRYVTKGHDGMAGVYAAVLVEGVKGRPIGELCAEHEISQAQYYQWRDQLLAKCGAQPPKSCLAARAIHVPGLSPLPGVLERSKVALRKLPSGESRVK